MKRKSVASFSGTTGLWHRLKKKLGGSAAFMLCIGLSACQSQIRESGVIPVHPVSDNDTQVEIMTTLGELPVVPATNCNDLEDDKVNTYLKGDMDYSIQPLQPEEEQ